MHSIYSKMNMSRTASVESQSTVGLRLGRTRIKFAQHDAPHWISLFISNSIIASPALQFLFYFQRSSPRSMLMLQSAVTRVDRTEKIESAFLWWVRISGHSSSKALADCNGYKSNNERNVITVYSKLRNQCQF
jgi:hypothetical protein